VKAIRVLLVDDHKMFRAGIRALMSSQRDMDVVGEASTGEEALELTATMSPDVVLLDIGLPGMGGIEVARRIRAEHPKVQILALTAHDRPEYFFEMLRAEVAGYVLKEAAPTELFTAVRAAHSGEAYFYPSVARKLLNDYLRRASTSAGDERESYDGLTPREREVLKLIAEGYSNRDIAERLVISVNTVEVHRTRLMRKLDLHKRAELVKYAIRSGLIDLGPS
jgi:two-component system response regulator NreC